MGGGEREDNEGVLAFGIREAEPRWQNRIREAQSQRQKCLVTLWWTVQVAALLMEIDGLELEHLPVVEEAPQDASRVSRRSPEENRSVVRVLSPYEAIFVGVGRVLDDDLAL